MNKYVIEIKYPSGVVEVENFKTDDINWTMEQYQRNRAPFSWTIKEVL